MPSGSPDRVRGKGPGPFRPRAFFPLLAVLFFAAACVAAPARGERLVFAGDANYPPFEFLEGGAPSGFTVELLRAVARVMNFDLEIRLLPWGEARRLLETGEVDGLTGYAYSPQREELADFSVPHSLLIHGVFFRKGGALAGPEGLRGRTVIVQEGEIMHDWILARDVARRVVTVPDPEGALRLLAAGEYDVALLNRYQGLFLCERLGLSNLDVAPFTLSESSFCFAVKKGRGDLVGRLNEGLRILKAAGEYRAIYEKWLGVRDRGFLERHLPKLFAAAAVVLLVLLAAFFWIATLRVQVAARTAELAASERKHRSLIESSPDAMLMHAGGRVLFANAAAARLFHRDAPAALEGVRFSRLVPGGEAAVAGTEPAPASLAIPGPDGGEVFVEARDIGMDPSATPARLCILRDVTARRHAEQALARQQELLAGVAGTSPVGILAADAPGVVVFSNGRAAELLGTAAEELAGMFLEEISALLRMEDGGDFAAAVRGVMTEGSPFMNRRCRSTAGDAGERILSLNGVPLRLTGAEGAVFTLEDITEVVAAEERKRQVDARMREARRLESLSLFAGGVAHDFNNLLMAVIGNVDLALLDVSPQNPAHKSLLEIGAAARKAAALCRQMLTYAGKGSFAAEPLDLNLVAREAARMLAPALPPGIRLRFRLSPEAAPARGDPAQLRQAVVSLLLNASEALAGTEGVVSVGTGTLVFRGAGAAGVWAAPPRAGVAYAWVEVTDTGRGMDPGSLEHIFEPFFSTKFMGRGLGLSAVLGIVRGHQGAVRVHSGEGQGTTVQLLIPLHSQT